MVSLNKSTRYGIYAAMALAASRGERPVPVTRVAAVHGIPGPVLAKVFQQLVRSGLVAGTRGAGGGYRLARDPSAVTLLDVIRVFEPARARPETRVRDGGVRRESGHAARLGQVFEEIDETVRCTFASITLATLVQSGTHAAGAAQELGR